MQAVGKIISIGYPCFAESKKIEGGSQMVDEIVAGWKVRYKNRPAMMDELSRL